MSQVAAPGTVIQIKVDEAFIARNGHNLTNPYIYVESLHRNAEMIALRNHLMGDPLQAEQESKP